MNKSVRGAYLWSSLDKKNPHTFLSLNTNFLTFKNKSDAKIYIENQQPLMILLKPILLIRKKLFQFKKQNLIEKLGLIAF